MPKKIVIPHDHPRYHSLITREKIVSSFKKGIVAHEGLIAHGRGESFDYLLGECTTDPAHESINAAAALLLLADYPVISVNGNTIALCVKELCELNLSLDKSGIEVNLFYHTIKRERLIAEEMKKYTTNKILGIGLKEYAFIPELKSNRRRVDPEGIFKADVVFVPLEDGDRTIALKNVNKKVITVDLNPLSRTAVTADITIVDNITRVIPLLLNYINYHKNNTSNSDLEKIVNSFNNKEILKKSLEIILSTYATNKN